MQSPKGAPAKRTSPNGSYKPQSKGNGNPNPYESLKGREGRAKWETMCRPKAAVLGQTDTHTHSAGQALSSGEHRTHNRKTVHITLLGDPREDKTPPPRRVLPAVCSTPDHKHEPPNTTLDAWVLHGRKELQGQLAGAGSGLDLHP